jgi:aspartate ammonia-lyase
MSKRNGELPVRGTRTERDPLGTKRLPDDVLHGVQTSRALETFRISTKRIHPLFITAYAEIKKAAAQANMATGELEKELGEAIVRAADEVIAGEWREEFQLDAFQAGAGTSYNMNLNEVLANRALEILGKARGDYERVNPNDDVNKSQSTNDTMPTVMRVTTIRLLRGLTEALEHLGESFEKKADEFGSVVKAGRTHLHDATPITLGEEFAAYGHNVLRAAERVRALEPSLLEVPLGGTAIGTSVNAHARYPRLAVARLAKITGLALREAEDKVQLTQSLGDFVAVSGAMRGIAVEVGKIANDLRLLNSGPHTGFNEIELPATQPGSSIMPGKVNPGVAEMLNMVCFHIIGTDVAITMCGEAGQLELNVMMPYVAYALFDGLDVMTNAVRTFDTECVSRIKAHREKCREYAERTVGRAALHNSELGFMGAADLANKAVETGKPVDQLLEEGAGEKQEA